MPSPGRPLAVVTGASSGICLGLAEQFAGNGFDVVVAAEDAGIARVGAGDAFATDTRLEDEDRPADAARDCFEALMAGKERVESASLMTKLQGRGGRLLPDAAEAALHRRQAEPGSAKG